MSELSDAELILEDIAAGVAILVLMSSFGLLVAIPAAKLILAVIIQTLV